MCLRRGAKSGAREVRHNASQQPIMQFAYQLSRFKEIARFWPVIRVICEIFDKNVKKTQMYCLKNDTRWYDFLVHHRKAGFSPSP
jgi:hypothetical protein